MGSIPFMRILVIYNCDTLLSESADNSFLCLNSRKSIQEVAKTIEKVLLKKPSREVILAPIAQLYEITNLVNEHAPNVVFNLCESIDNDTAKEIDVVQQLEKLRVPYTGNSSQALANCLDKFECNQRLSHCDIPTPASYVIRCLDDLINFEFKHTRYIVKPNDQDGSTGIDDCCVVSDYSSLKTKVEHLFSATAQSLIVQEYIEGRELNFAFVGNRPNIHWCPSEIIFSYSDAKKPRILNYSSKWLTDSDDFASTNSSAVILSDELNEKIHWIIQSACNELEITSYGRFDFRLDDKGTPYIIDVNPNCDLDPNAGMAKANAFNGISYDALIEAILTEAINR